MILLHRLRAREEALFEDEFTALAQRRALDLHLLVGPRRYPGSWLPDLTEAHGLSDDDVLRRLVPDVVRRDAFRLRTAVVGPSGAPLASPGGRAGLAVHLERFGW